MFTSGLVQPDVCHVTNCSSNLLNLGSIYMPLDTGKRQVKLLHLNSGDDSIELSGALVVVSLNDEP